MLHSMVGMAANILEEAGSKLICSDPPKGVRNVAELKIRLDMWQRDKYEEVLNRIEAQVFEKRVVQIKRGRGRRK